MTFQEERYRDAPSCLRAMRERIEGGWRVVDIEGADRGPLAVIYARTTGETSVLDRGTGDFGG